MKARKSGFTLVEILIVVVILGILAAIVIPQFTDASTEAKESALCSDLQTMRSQIELYKIQHNDNPPSLATFKDQMTEQTDVEGDPGVDYGPYLQQVPTNQFNDSKQLDGSGAAGGPGVGGDAEAGWDYDETNGEIHPNDALSSPNGTAHFAL